MLGKNQRSSRPQNGACAAMQHRTAVQYIVARERTSVGFKLAVRGDPGAGGLVAPLPCTAYFGKLAEIVWLFLATASVGLVYLYTYHSLA